MRLDTSLLEKIDPDMARTVAEELKRQRGTLELIASENFASPAVMRVQGSVLRIEGDAFALETSHGRELLVQTTRST